MLHELTITVDDVAYKVIKPMVEQQTIGTLHHIDTSDIRDETDRSL